MHANIHPPIWLIFRKRLHNFEICTNYRPQHVGYVIGYWPFQPLLNTHRLLCALSARYPNSTEEHLLYGVFCNVIFVRAQLKVNQDIFCSLAQQHAS